MQKLISFLFSLLLVVVPIIFYPYSSEVFEFNKIITVYIFSVLIFFSCIVRMILEKKFIFKRTLLDIPLFVFLGSQIISTHFSIDPHTSIFGYYSRFNGSLLSTISYILLYWAFVSNMDKSSTLKSLRFLLYSVLFVSVYAIFEHYGKSISCLFITYKFNADCWVQDVQERVFATMGQPNWLAALLAAVLPITWYEFLLSKGTKKITAMAISVSLFASLIFTKSRSGLLAFTCASLIFWLPNLRKHLKPFLILNFIFIIIVAVFGSPWTPSIRKFLQKQKASSNIPEEQKLTYPALETGGTESGEIRKIVWKGAFDLWKKYPITGTGVETFGLAYYETRPKEHNLVSEWDYLYNKAHNEYLNYLATTGALGLSSYALVIVFSLLQIAKAKSKSSSALFAGYLSILITNFFGFSVAIVSLLFFLFPAAAFALNQENRDIKMKFKLNTEKILGTIIAVIFSLLILNYIIKYWTADFYFSQSKSAQGENNYKDAIEKIEKSIKISPKEAIYHDQLARLYSGIAVLLKETKDTNSANEFSLAGVNESNTAFSLSERNVNLQRSRANIFTDLGGIDSKYLAEAVNILEFSSIYSPTDAKLFYKLGLSYLRINQRPKSIENFSKAVDLKPNYVDARLALGLILEEDEQKEKAIGQYEYILTRLDPNNKLAKERLESLKLKIP